MQLNLPKYDLKIISRNGKKLVFDKFRKKYVALTPEEYVRQHVAIFLVEEKGFPQSLTAIEYSLDLYGTKKRADIVNFDKNSNVIMITECKAPEVKITQQVFEQIARYNINLNADFLLVTNGINHYCCKFLSDSSYTFIKDIPSFKDITK